MVAPSLLSCHNNPWVSTIKKSSNWIKTMSFRFYHSIYFQSQQYLFIIFLKILEFSTHSVKYNFEVVLRCISWVQRKLIVSSVWAHGCAHMWGSINHDHKIKSFIVAMYSIPLWLQQGPTWNTSSYISFSAIIWP